MGRMAFGPNLCSYMSKYTRRNSKTPRSPSNALYGFDLPLTSTFGQREKNEYLEMQCDERKHKRLQILHNIVKYSQALWILAVIDIRQRTDFRRLSSQHFTHRTRKISPYVWKMQMVTYPERYMILAQLDLQFLFAILVWLWPFGIVFSRGGRQRPDQNPLDSIL